MKFHVALRFAYDGGQFPSGYARQPQGGTVEDAIIQAARKEGYVAKSWMTGSRTDRNVSARENVASLVLERDHINGIVPAMQAHLPSGVWLTGACEVAKDWNPRYHALRQYGYLAPKNGESLDDMARAAACFEGTHNMNAFARVEPHRNQERTIALCRVVDAGDAWRFHVASPGFLWNQVRRMVGMMLQVGRGAMQASDIETALASGVKPDGTQLVPAEGLLLESVEYTPKLEWDPKAGALTRRRIAKEWQAAKVRAGLLEDLSASS